MFTIKKGAVVEAEYGRFVTRVAAEKELARRAKRNKARKERDDVMKSLGLTKVRGSVSGRIYWE